jgi:hypothetical protein
MTGTMRLIRTAHHGTRFPALASNGEDVEIGEVVEVEPGIASTLLARGFEPHEDEVPTRGRIVPEDVPEDDEIDEDIEEDFEE